MSAGSTRYDLDQTEWATLLADEPAYRVEQVWRGLYGDLTDLVDVTTLPRGLRDHLVDAAPAALTTVTESLGDNGTTRKWLWRLTSGEAVETVLMLYPDRATVCVSTQAGCAMACSFCATGQAGFDRHLSVGEIVEQVVRAAAAAAPRRVSNVVFMGMGEPLANFDPTWAAVERIHGAMGVSARSLTISTVGLIPGIRRLAQAPLPVNLAVSLHAADDELRDSLVPINRRYPIADLVAACVDYFAATGRRVSFEWAMIAGVNDRDVDARRLAAHAREVGAHVNLIPLNPTPDFGTPGTSPDGIDRFHRLLRELGVNATVRRNRGTDIDAACGQLRARVTSAVDASPVELRRR